MDDVNDVRKGWWLMFRKLVIGMVTLGMGAGVIGCQSNAGTGALVGGAAGAGIGAIIGHNSHGRTASGAAIGGAAGAIGGALVGNEVDKKEAREREQRDRETYSAPPRQSYYERDDYNRPPPPPSQYDDRYYDRSAGGAGY
jgi:hypothetical protein